MMMPHIKQSEHLKINLQAIELATNNFTAANYIGEGGFGKVYKGEIDHYEGHTMAAFKRLDLLSGSRQGDNDKQRTIKVQYGMKSLSSVSTSNQLKGYYCPCTSMVHRGSDPIFGQNIFQISENYIYISLADVMNKIYINEDYGLMKSKNKHARLRVELNWRSFS
ncbi:protein kinase, ATP binding site-containing protein [Tanacetum coccineum]